jgi:hypothetical protein
MGRWAEPNLTVAILTKILVNAIRVISYPLCCELCQDSVAKCTPKK